MAAMASHSSVALIKSFLLLVSCLEAGFASPTAALKPSGSGHLHSCDRSQGAYYVENPTSCRFYFICDSAGNLYDADCGEHGVFYQPAIACLHNSQVSCTRDMEEIANEIEATTVATLLSSESTTISSPQPDSTTISSTSSSTTLTASSTVSTTSAATEMTDEINSAAHVHPTQPPRFKFFTTSGFIEPATSTAQPVTSVSESSDVADEKSQLKDTENPTTVASETNVPTSQDSSPVSPSSLASTEAPEETTFASQTHTRPKFFTTLGVPKPSEETTQSVTQVEDMQTQATVASATVPTMTTLQTTSTLPSSTTSKVMETSPAPSTVSPTTLTPTEMPEDTSASQNQTHFHPTDFELLTTSGVQKPSVTTTVVSVTGSSTTASATVTNMSTLQTTSTLPSSTTSKVMDTSPAPSAVSPTTLTSTEMPEDTSVSQNQTHFHPTDFELLTTSGVQKPSVTTTLPVASVTGSSTTASATIPKMATPATTSASSTTSEAAVTTTTATVQETSSKFSTSSDYEDALSFLGGDYDYFEDSQAALSDSTTTSSNDNSFDYPQYDSNNFADYGVFGNDFSDDTLYDYGGAEQDYDDYFGGEDETQNEPKKVNHCFHHPDGDYIPQSMIAKGCREYVNCQDDETQIKLCPGEMTFDWKVSKCVDPELNSVADCRPGSLQQASLDYGELDFSNLVEDSALSKECLHRKDGLYISQELISGGCKSYISCKRSNGKMETCPDGHTFDWKLAVCVKPEDNTVPDCLLVNSQPTSPTDKTK